MNGHNAYSFEYVSYCLETIFRDVGQRSSTRWRSNLPADFSRAILLLIERASQIPVAHSDSVTANQSDGHQPSSRSNKMTAAVLAPGESGARTWRRHRAPLPAPMSAQQLQRIVADAFANHYLSAAQVVAIYPRIALMYRVKECVLQWRRKALRLERHNSSGLEMHLRPSTLWKTIAVALDDVTLASQLNQIFPEP